MNGRIVVLKSLIMLIALPALACNVLEFRCLVAT